MPDQLSVSLENHAPQTVPLPATPLPSVASTNPTPVVNSVSPVFPAAGGAEGIEYAGVGARFLASMVDGMIVGAIYFVLMIPVFIFGVAAGMKGNNSPVLAALTIIIQGAGWLLTIFYYVYFTAKGQTWGKKALKIRVVRAENGEAPGYTKAFLREVVGKLMSATVFGLGYLWMLWDGKKQTWHDKIGGTVVVKA